MRFLLLFGGVVFVWRGFSSVEGSTCGPRVSARLLRELPCDMSRSTYCTVPGTAYPWQAVRRFIYDNQGLVRRMYGDQRHSVVINDDILARSATSTDPTTTSHPNVRRRQSRVRPNSRYTRKHMDGEDISTNTEDVTASTTTPVLSSSSIPTSTATSRDISLDTTLEAIQSSTILSDTGPSTLLPFSEVKLTTATQITSTTDGITIPTTVVATDDGSNTSSIGQLDQTTAGVTDTTNIVIVANDSTTVVTTESSTHTDVIVTFSTNNNTDQTTVLSDQTVTISTETPVTAVPESANQLPVVGEKLALVSKSNLYEEGNINKKEQAVEENRIDLITEDSSGLEQELEVEHIAEETEATSERPHATTKSSRIESPSTPKPSEPKGMPACPVEQEMIAPYWANNTRGEVLALLNVYPFEQYVHAEKCAPQKGVSQCRSHCRCEQQYRLHRLLAFDPKNECRGIFSDWFRFPSCCVCMCYDSYADWMSG